MSPIRTRMLGPSDAHVLDNVAEQVFDHTIRSEWAAAFFADGQHRLAVAQAGDLVVGMASAVIHQHPDKRPQLFVNEVGVARGYRRQGIATQLVRLLLDSAVEAGCREAWVATEESNLAARALYRALEGSEEPERAVVFTFKIAPP